MHEGKSKIELCWKYYQRGKLLERNINRLWLIYKSRTLSKQRAMHFGDWKVKIELKGVLKTQLLASLPAWHPWHQCPVCHERLHVILYCHVEDIVNRVIALLSCCDYRAMKIIALSWHDCCATCVCGACHIVLLCCGHVAT